jgi:hypothetical protein
MAGPRAPVLTVDAHGAAAAAHIAHDLCRAPDERLDPERLCRRLVQVAQDDGAHQPDAAAGARGEHHQLRSHRRAEPGGNGGHHGGPAEQAECGAEGEQLGDAEQGREHQPDDPDVHRTSPAIGPVQPRTPP